MALPNDVFSDTSSTPARTSSAVTFGIQASAVSGPPPGSGEPKGSGYLVTIVPKRKQILLGITKLELWVDGASFLPEGMHLTFPSGDTRLMVFDEVELNPSIDWDAEMARQAKPRH